MTGQIRDRISERLETLGKNPFEVARNAGFERTYVNDLLRGHKQSFRRGAVVKIAEQLDCDPEYLTGEQDQPRLKARVQSPGQRAGGQGTMMLSGVCEAGVWRDSAPASTPIPLEADPRFQSSAQAAYLVRGDHAVGFHGRDGKTISIADGTLISTISTDVAEIERGGLLRPGDLVVVKRSRGREFELAIRQVALSDGRLVLVSGPQRNDAPIDYPPADGDASVEILGLILRAVSIFGAPI